MPIISFFTQYEASYAIPISKIIYSGSSLFNFLVQFYRSHPTIKNPSKPVIDYEALMLILPCEVNNNYFFFCYFSKISYFFVFLAIGNYFGCATELDVSGVFDSNLDDFGHLLHNLQNFDKRISRNEKGSGQFQKTI